MTKTEMENYIYDKIVEIGVNRQLGIIYFDNTISIYEEAISYFRLYKNWYVDIDFDYVTKYYTIKLHSWSTPDDLTPDIYLYVNDIEDTIRTKIRNHKINSLVD